MCIKLEEHSRQISSGLEFETTEPWAYFRVLPHNNNDKTSSDMGSVPDPKIESSNSGNV